jgi:hypothetical protein
MMSAPDGQNAIVAKPGVATPITASASLNMPIWLAIDCICGATAKTEGDT